MAERDREMPTRGTVDPRFDGHPARTLLELDVDERIEWIWEAMFLLRLGMGLVHPPEELPLLAADRSDPDSR